MTGGDVGAASALALLPVCVALAACRTDQTIITPDPHLERMLAQEKVVPYGEAPQLPRGMAMQRPPQGTLPTDAIVGRPLITTGVDDGRYAATIPVAVDRALIESGRTNFDVFCAACHGILGDGTSVVADRMALRKPPDLGAAPIRDYPPGRVFEAIRQGYGLMPSYAAQLSIGDSWGVVAYVRALQLARRARVADLPPDVRAELEKEAP